MRVTFAVLAVVLVCVSTWASEQAVVGTSPTAHRQSRVANPSSTDAITIPALLSYQGKLTDTLGNPVPDSTYSVTFRLYTLPSGGSPFFDETQDVTTRSGLFSVLLGSAQFLDSVPQSGNLYLGMRVGTGAELVPRLRIASAPYSFCTDNAAKLAGYDVPGLDGRYVNEGQSGSVSSTMIADATIAAVDLSQMGATTGQVMKWTGAAWVPRNDSAGRGSLTSVSQAAGVVCTPNPITTTGTVAFDATYGDGRYVNEAQANSVTGAMILDGSIAGVDIAVPCTLSASVSPGAVLVVNNTGGGDALLAQGTARFSGQIVSTVTDRGAAGDSRGHGPGKDAAPIVVSSSTLCANLNSDLLDGYTAASSGVGVIPFTDSSGRLDPAVVPVTQYVDSARVAANSHALQGKDTTAFAPAVHNHDSSYVNEGQVDAVTSLMIADTNVTMAKLAGAGAATGEVVKWNGSSWAPAADSAGGPPSGPAGGALTGTYPDPAIKIGAVGSGEVLDASLRGVDIAVPCTLAVSASLPAFQIAQSGDGAGIYVTRGVTPATNPTVVGINSGSGAGVLGEAAETVSAGILGRNHVGGPGVFGYSGDAVPTPAIDAGVAAQSQNGPGVYVGSAGTHGVAVLGPGMDGVHVDSAADDGIEVANCQYGVYAHDAAYTGVIGSGLWGGAFSTTSAAGVGLLANAYNNDPADTAIYVQGVGLATGGWSTGFVDGAAPCLVSQDRMIAATGTARLDNGQAKVDYPPLFRAHVRTDVPVRFSLTPRGNPAGVLCVSASDASGFSVRLKTVPGWDGSEDVEFDWIAYGTLEEPATTPADRAAWDKLASKKPSPVPSGSSRVSPAGR